jgi:hypothetical protein
MTAAVYYVCFMNSLLHGLLRNKLDFDVNRRAESEIQALSRKLNLLTDKVGDVDDLLRGKLTPGGA